MNRPVRDDEQRGWYPCHDPDRTFDEDMILHDARGDNICHDVRIILNLRKADPGEPQA